ncbi:hypothetical protein CL622_08990 [archaeon]|nr:hypothetical protein [archaeon]
MIFTRQNHIAEERLTILPVSRNSELMFSLNMYSTPAYNDMYDDQKKDKLSVTVDIGISSKVLKKKTPKEILKRIISGTISRFYTTFRDLNGYAISNSSQNGPSLLMSAQNPDLKARTKSLTPHSLDFFEFVARPSNQKSYANPDQPYVLCDLVVDGLKTLDKRFKAPFSKGFTMYFSFISAFTPFDAKTGRYCDPSINLDELCYQYFSTDNQINDTDFLSLVAYRTNPSQQSFL